MQVNLLDLLQRQDILFGWVFLWMSRLSFINDVICGSFMTGKYPIRSLFLLIKGRPDLLLTNLLELDIYVTTLTFIKRLFEVIIHQAL